MVALFELLTGIGNFEGNIDRTLGLADDEFFKFPGKASDVYLKYSSKQKYLLQISSAIEPLTFSFDGFNGNIAATIISMSKGVNEAVMTKLGAIFGSKFQITPSCLEGFGEYFERNYFLVRQNGMDYLAGGIRLL